MKKLLVILSTVSMILAQGKIGGVTYFDLTSNDDSTSFNFKRQYFGYSLNASENVKFKVLFDVGRTNEIDDEDTRLVAFLKKAQVDYSCSWGTTSLGLIGMNTYNIQEKNWGYRFIEKSAIDKYGYSSTADIGIGFSKSVTDELNLNLQVVNGEGFKSPQNDKYQKIAFNATYGNKNLTKSDGFNAGVVYTTEQTDSDSNIMTSMFGGFANYGFRFGLEYDTFKEENKESNLISISGSHRKTEKFEIFMRYDNEQYTDDDKEYLSSKELIFGVIFNCNGGLSIAPNVRMTTYEDDTVDSDTEFKINFQFKF